MINVAMLSKWHVHASDYAKQVRNSDDARISCIWDEDAERGLNWAKELGVDCEENLDTLLKRDDVDAVIINTSTSDHCHVMVLAANAGKHIFTEKAMAPTLDECRKISTAVANNNVKFCISHPNLTTSFVQYAKQVMDEGLLGDVNYMRMRSAHGGTILGWLPDYWYDVEKAGGGAMMDLGCHPMYTAAYLLGQPNRIASVFNTNFCPEPADDNAVSVVEFKNKAIAVLETGFITPWSANCFELLGTEGALIQVGSEVKIRSTKLGIDGWIIPDSLPDPLPTAMHMWIDGIIHGKPIPFDTKKGEALTELLENAYISHREQQIIKI
ncbi:MAG TPA: gfo/Idh/MocA family oxidoreductase [Clostridiales bacterium]|nr:gfo/Idh/MocA family oxidoreductase [Clostridiales bacterium]